MLRDASETGVASDEAFNRTRADAAKIAGSVNGAAVTAIVQEKSGKRIGAGVKIVLDALSGGLGDENRAIFTAFASDHELATFEIDGIAIESN